MTKHPPSHPLPSLWGVPAYMGGGLVYVCTGGGTRALKNYLLQNLVFPGVQSVCLLFRIGRTPGTGTPPETGSLP